MSCISQNDFPTPQYVSVSPIGAAGKAEWLRFLGQARTWFCVTLGCLGEGNAEHVLFFAVQWDAQCGSYFLHDFWQF